MKRAKHYSTVLLSLLLTESDTEGVWTLALLMSGQQHDIATVSGRSADEAAKNVAALFDRALGRPRTEWHA